MSQSQVKGEEAGLGQAVSPGTSLCPFTCSGAGALLPPQVRGAGSPTALASSPQRLRTVPRCLPAPPARRPERGDAGGIRAISSATRGMWPARCPTTARPGGGGRAARASRQPRLAAAGASLPCSGFPGGLSRSGGLCGAPGRRLLPARPQPEPVPALPSSLTPASPLPALQTVGGPQNLEFEVGPCSVTLRQVPSPF